MKVVEKIDDLSNLIYVVEICEGKFVDVKHCVDEDYFYVMELSSGGQVYDENYAETNTGLDYEIDEGEIIAFVKQNVTRPMQKDNIKIEGCIGTWHVINETMYHGEKVFWSIRHMEIWPPA